jgi:sigma-B regulation protein RsbU (phosphoserine phosphatase)
MQKDVVQLPPEQPSVAAAHRQWRERLDFIVETMRVISAQTDPQQMVEVYGARMRKIMPIDRFLAVSRRDTPPPFYKVTRNSDWPEQINPWKSPHKLPLLSGGLVGQMLYSEEPTILGNVELEEGDPSEPFLRGMKSLLAVPLFDAGKALNMVLLMRKEPDSFEHESLPEQVWVTNLFGRATHSLVLSLQLQEAYDAVDRELQVVGDIQNSLLPGKLPEIPTLELATYYQTSKRAGGDYYDFFPLPGAHGEPAKSPRGRWGILIADVSGHGTPAAVLMAVTHSIAHTCCQEPTSPGELLRFVNHHLCARYTNGNGTFVTAFYGIYDPVSRELRFASAGHCPPRLRRGHEIVSLDEARHLPLGIEADEPYGEFTLRLKKDDLLVLYTDGITEARNKHRELLGIPRLDKAVCSCEGSPDDCVKTLLAAVEHFEQGIAAADDRTLLVAKVG